MGTSRRALETAPGADAGNALPHGQYLAQDFPVL